MLSHVTLEQPHSKCHRDHRSTDVLYLLWRSIGQYAMRCGGRYLVGCCSLTSQDPTYGTAVCHTLREYLVGPELRTHPQPEFAMPPVSSLDASSHLPKLQRTYLAIGAKVCGPPAIDREFKTIAFITLRDLETLHPRVRARFLLPR